MQIIERQAQLLRALANSPSEGVSVRAAANNLGWSPSTTHRLLRALMDVGMVTQDPKTQTYRLGYEILSLAGAYLERIGLTELIDPYLERIAQTTGMVSFSAVRDSHTVICTAVRVPADATNFYVRVGRHLPLHASAGAKALIYDLEKPRLEQMLSRSTNISFNENTLGTVQEVLDDLDEGRNRGYWTCNEELERGVWGVAAPIRTPAGHPVISLSILSLSKFGKEKGGPVEVLTSVARSASREVGTLLSSAQLLETS